MSSEDLPVGAAAVTSNAAPVGYGDFLAEIKTQIRQRQYQALRAANRELLELYWWLGENICRRPEEQGWGKAVVQALARDLQAEFPGRNGFSAQNLWAMRQFFVEYRDKPKLQSLIGVVSWAKNLPILARCKDDLEREFYLRATARFGWTKNLRHPVGRVSPKGVTRQYPATTANRHFGLRCANPTYGGDALIRQKLGGLGYEF